MFYLWCKGFVSEDGNSNNNRAKKELLSKVLVGMLLAKNLVVTYEGQTVWEVPGPHIIGWVNRVVPLSPKRSDPQRTDCPAVSTL